jgi:hypothetical protein
MLDWRRVGDSWLGNGFRVRQVAPSHWTLEYVEAPVAIDVEGPIAELSSLEACQHKAESLHDETKVKETRRRLAAVGAGGWALAVLSANPIGFLIGGVVGSAALLELAATWFERRVGSASEITQ